MCWFFLHDWEVAEKKYGSAVIGNILFGDREEPCVYYLEVCKDCGARQAYVITASKHREDVNVDIFFKGE